MTMLFSLSCDMTGRQRITYLISLQDQHTKKVDIQYVYADNGVNPPPGRDTVLFLLLLVFHDVACQN